MWGIQGVSFAFPFKSCETSTFNMLLVCRCTFSTSDNIKDHIWIGAIDGMSSLILPTFSTKQHYSSSTIKHKKPRHEKKNIKTNIQRTFQTLKNKKKW